MRSDSRGSITHIAALSCCRPGGSSGIPEEPQELPPAKLSAGPTRCWEQETPKHSPCRLGVQGKEPKNAGLERGFVHPEVSSFEQRFMEAPGDT